MFRKSVRAVVQMIAALAVFPAAVLAGFGRFEPGFLFCAQSLCLVPGLVGSYLRVAYYRFTLTACGADNYIAIGSYFSHPQASMGRHVGIGAFCVVGQVDIGDDTMIASGVQILSGGQQHVRNEEGRLTDEGRQFRRLRIGRNCWIGAGSVVLADLADSVTVAAGTVVGKDMPAGATVAGNPCRIVRLGSGNGAAKGEVAVME